MYMMSFFAIPKGVLKKLNYFRSRFFWQGDESKRKYRLARWNILCQPKDQGGLGIHDLNIKNTALLSKWLFKLLTSDGTWQQFLRNKYLGSKPLVQVDWKTGDSRFWSSLMKVKQNFLRFGTFKIKNGSQVRFWEDAWFEGQGLKDRYPGLYSIARKKFITIAEALTDTGAAFSWRRTLIGPSLTQSDQFSVKSHYQALIKNEVPNLNKRLWKLKAPLKIKVFLWYLRRGVILTKDNLAKRNWHGDISYCFCHKPETIKHLFLERRFAPFGIRAPSSISNMFGSWLEGFNHNIRNIVLLGAASVSWALWLTRNDIVFERKTIYSPLQVIYVTFHWLRTWAVLQKAD
ncbi:hypothetical protein U9M48_023328 [Paspalum notatum var. saurae]|uniref:Reverse transcriptase zinc-binding domain-containing protein n=1 Tax=Paspalum notatum var. saurae TaxID=547442 RepID=A0AAQ3TJL6_PASNO